MKVVIFGASGIIGQHMRLCCPEGVTPVYVRRHGDALHVGLDLTDRDAREAFLAAERPDVIVNLAGESNTDVVQQNPAVSKGINTDYAVGLVIWCQAHSCHIVQVSTQAVFSGDCAPYAPESRPGPINEYGKQKALAEYYLFDQTIVRPTFVLGIRPLPHVGRVNPMEQMLSGGHQKQVNDRWFSVSFARDVAAALWKAAIERPGGIIHVGLPDRVSRFDIATKTASITDVQNPSIEPISHDSFPGLAPRPIDTTYAGNVVPGQLEDGIWECSLELADRKAMRLPARAREIALFLGKREDECLARLSQGWEAIHNAVSSDWNSANPKNDDEILDWYRRTEQYIWELSFYHADPGWNYSGMCAGIAERLKAAGAKRVLCLGDGIGDLTLSLHRAGFEAVYHDLAGSRTAEFAHFRFWAQTGAQMSAHETGQWNPEVLIVPRKYDAIVSLDFLEHVPNVEAWVAAIKSALNPDGLFCAQNAFAIGSGEQGSMPMHLARNDRFEKDWDPTLFGMGFMQESSNWYRVPAEVAVMA